MRALLPLRPQHGTLGSGVILTFFGTVWWMVGALALGDGTATRAAAVATGLAVAVALGVFAVRRLDNTGGRESYERAASTFRWSNAAQAAGIAAVVAIGVGTGRQHWIPALVTLVVGAHFYPLARPFGRPEYRWTASLLVGVGVIGCVAALAGAQVSGVLALCGLGCAVILWSTTVWYIVCGTPDIAAAAGRSAGATAGPHGA
ncbi:hypothetical protein [Streptomyces harbinensis]|uniref:hypothetical protein n=1 Tax=Streptomyces harbinensis TaxID=1176198 RepID=UPI0034DF8044